jgi:hypothetical protein
MEPATISALAALAGATVGGVTSFAATWLTQRTQARIQQLTHQLNRREDLYKAFIEEASKLYGDALVHQLSDVYKLVGLYSLISRMRIISSKATVAAADEIARTIIKTYDAPDKNLADLQDMVNRDQIDILRTFGEVARQEFHRLGV